MTGYGYNSWQCSASPNIPDIKNFAIGCGGVGSGSGSDSSPIIIDVDGSGYHLTSADNGVVFDFFGDGNPVRIAWTAKGSTNAFLVRDLYGTGKITNATEMFGNLTEQPATTDPNGFIALAQYDTNHDGWIDSKDEIWSKLLLWQDLNHNGVTDESELHSLDDLGVKRISVTYQEDRKVDQYGNQFRYRGAINDASEDHRVYDVIFRYSASGT